MAEIAALEAAAQRTLAQVALVVREYDEAIDFFVRVLDFELIEDTPILEQSKRWVVVRPRGSSGAALLLARASSPRQDAAIGAQAAGRVFLFLHTDDIERDVRLLTQRGVEFVRPISDNPYGKVAVFADIYGNLWDLIEPA